MSELDRLAEVLGKRTLGKWEADRAVDRNGEESRAIYTRPTEHHVVEILESPDTWNGECIHNEGDQEAICAAMNTIDALVEVARASEELLRLRPDDYWLLRALRKSSLVLEATIAEALK